MAVVVTSQNFQSEVLDYQGLALVDFWASWCGPCQMLSPIIEEIATEYQNKVKVVKVDTDQDSDLANKYNVSSLPTVIFFDHGQVKATIIGFKQKQEYLSIINH